MYFDRHTLNLKNSRVSMYTLDGRIKFNLKLDDEQASLFRDAHLREVVMTAQDEGLILTFNFDDQHATESEHDADEIGRAHELPEYVVVLDDHAPPVVPHPLLQVHPKGIVQ